MSQSDISKVHPVRTNMFSSIGPTRSNSDEKKQRGMGRLRRRNISPNGNFRFTGQSLKQQPQGKSFFSRRSTKSRTKIAVVNPPVNPNATNEDSTTLAPSQTEADLTATAMMIPEASDDSAIGCHMPRASHSTTNVVTRSKTSQLTKRRAMKH